jgi:predicted membrane protein
VAPVVLGPILEQNFIVSMIRTEWDLTQFFIRPAAILGALTVLIRCASLYPILHRRLRGGAFPAPARAVDRSAGTPPDAEDLGSSQRTQA